MDTQESKVNYIRSNGEASIRAVMAEIAEQEVFGWRLQAVDVGGNNPEFRTIGGKTIAVIKFERPE